MLFLRAFERLSTDLIPKTFSGWIKATFESLFFIRYGEIVLINHCNSFLSITSIFDVSKRNFFVLLMVIPSIRALLNPFIDSEFRKPSGAMYMYSLFLNYITLALMELSKIILFNIVQSN